MKRLVALFLMALGCMPVLRADTTLRVLTYNIHHAEGTDEVLNLERIARVIQSEHPDVVCLQEVDQGCTRTNQIDMPAGLAKLLNMEVRFGANLEFQGGKYGNATLSRFPVVSSENISFPFSGTGEKRGCLRVTLSIDGQEVDIYNTHFDLIATSRRVQAESIVGRLRDVPSVVAGDLNESAGDPALRILLSRLLDSFLWQTGKREGTLQGKDSKDRIDFILVSKSVNVLSSRVVDTPEACIASDHLPYVAELTLEPAKETAADKGVRDNEDERVERALVPEE
ncbi:MAG: endonuclease/exonuclease/phosphatase family protein [Candidatus Hydrogenedentes bacterium]|nr:endonuclease/exonuclease/phosphatase family protein [Candidatus Hydrogenedentota bacterium]